MLNKRFFSTKRLAYILSFLLPFLSIFIYFAINHFNLLTVDLGQQYIDFLAFFRQNFFTNPLKLIYNFQNGLGGSMIATDAYYLMSPFNFVLFFFPKSQITFAVLTIISLKFAFCGLSYFYYWYHQKNYDVLYSLAASFAYALSGYTVANYFNLMWLDSVILLPLLINAIDETLLNKKDSLILVTFALWVTNFYTGIMALFFGLIYFISQLIIKKRDVQINIIRKYLLKSIAGSFLASFILLPVFFELLTGKAQVDSQWAISWQFNLAEELGKFSSASYNYHEMESGLPNLFMTSVMLFAVVTYFLTKKVANREKIVNGILLIFFIISLSFTPLVLFWHLGQMPIWYPGRFSFVLIFFCLNLAMTSLKQQSSFLFWQKAVIGIAAIGLVSYWTIEHKEFTYFSDTSLIISTLFIVLTLLFFFFIFNKHHFDKLFLVGITAIEVVVNLILSLNNISFQENRDYQNFANNLSQVTKYNRQTDANLYRTEKIFSRSDDDPFTAEYNGISNFNSVTNPNVLNFLSQLGLLHNSNSYTNNGGTPITDSFFGIKYYIIPNYEHKYIPQNQQMYFDNNNERLDVDNYETKKHFKQLTLLKNSGALPLLFTTDFHDQQLNFVDDNPALNQNKLLQYLTKAKIQSFKLVNWPMPKLENLKQQNINHRYLVKNAGKQANLTFNIKLKSNDSYYLNIPSGINEDDIDLFVNDQRIDLTSRDDQDHLINLASRQKGLNLKIVFALKQSALDFIDFNLYRFNNQLVKRSFLSLNKNQPIPHMNSALSIKTNNFKLSKKKQVLSTIPYSHNWLIFDNGKRISTKTFAKTFITFNLNKGHHQITLIYIPWLLILGIIISLITLIVLKLYLY